jgi:alpha-L-rhamnosidase
MLMELTRHGHHDQAWQLITNRTFPSWGYMLENGATTIWERWDGYVKGRGFQDPGMNSFNHWAFGAVGEWMMRHLGGINPDEEQPGFRHFIVQPRPVKSLPWAKATYDSVRGPISTSWANTPGNFTLDVQIPPNTTATVILPVNTDASVTESHQPLSARPEIRLVRRDKEGCVLEVASGTYHFAATTPASR